MVLQTNPSTTPDAVQEWTRELNVSEVGRVGFMRFTLTNWNEATTSVPYVDEGSIIEINNSLFVETAVGGTALDVTGATDTAIYYVIVKFTGTPAVATAYLEPTAPTASDWDAAKGGFFNGSGYRWTGHYMYKSGANYSQKGFLDYANGAMLKYRIDDEGSDFVIDAAVEVKSTLNVNGNTTIGGVADVVSFTDLRTDNVNIKHKKLSGTTPASSPLNIAHGLNVDKILYVGAVIDRQSPSIPPTTFPLTTVSETIFISSTNIYITLGAEDLSSPYRIIITYEA